MRKGNYVPAKSRSSVDRKNHFISSSGPKAVPKSQMIVKKDLRVLPVHIIHPREDSRDSLYIAQEFESLVTTLGGHIVERTMQKVGLPDSSTYIGRGKVEEIIQMVEEKEVDVVVLNTTMKPGQIHNIKERLQKVHLQIEVWDRVDLILHIFEKHAATVESKLQIELARMRYMGPRIFGMGYVMSNQGGGIGTRGVGETNTELMKRHWRDAIKTVTDQLEKMSKSRNQQLERRKKAGFKTVSIVGYTNAGKSSLFNLLSKKDVLVENALFATLDSSVGKLYLPEIQKEILVTDTIGFIRDLPPRLVDAFKSTLTESLHADILLHVIDASDPEVDLKIHVVNEILHELGRKTDDLVYVFNKADLLTDKEEFEKKYAFLQPIFISVKDGSGINLLISRITSLFSSEGM